MQWKRKSESRSLGGIFWNSKFGSGYKTGDIRGFLFSAEDDNKNVKSKVLKMSSFVLIGI